MSSHTDRSSDIEIIPFKDLERLWEENGVAQKRAAGLFIEIIVDESPAADPLLAGTVAYTIKLQTKNGIHIGTLHEVIAPDGSVLHSHPKDYIRRDCSRVRA